MADQACDHVYSQSRQSVLFCLQSDSSVLSYWGTLEGMWEVWFMVWYGGSNIDKQRLKTNDKLFSFYYQLIANVLFNCLCVSVTVVMWSIQIKNWKKKTVSFVLSSSFIIKNFIYDNCFYDLIGSLKLEFHLTMMWLFFVFEFARERVFGWIPWLIDKW